MVTGPMNLNDNIHMRPRLSEFVKRDPT
jgi:hypothetical protein